MSWRKGIARILAPEEFAALEKKKAEMDLIVNQRIADVLFKMDPFEPLLKKYNVIFSEEWTHPEERLDDQSQIRLYAWAHGMEKDPSFLHVMNWVRNTQGNATLQKAKNDQEWLYGRAAISTITLLVKEVGRLSSKYKELLSVREKTFNENLPIGEI